MNKHLRLIAAILCIAPCIAYANFRTPQNEALQQAINLTIKLEVCRAYLTLGQNQDALHRSIALCQEKLRDLPELSHDQKEHCRIKAQLSFRETLLFNLEANKVDQAAIDTAKKNIAFLEGELKKVESQIAGKPALNLQKQALLEQFKTLLTTEAHSMQMLQNTRISDATRQSLTQDLRKAQLDIAQLKAHLTPQEIDTIEKQVAALPPVKELSQQEKLDLLVMLERNRQHQIANGLTTLAPEQMQKLMEDLERIQGGIKQIRAQQPPSEVTDVEETYKNVFFAKQATETLINTLLSKPVRNPREEDELATALQNLDKANDMLKALETEMEKSRNKPALNRSTTSRGQAPINPLAPIGASTGLAGNCVPMEDMATVFGENTSVPAAPSSSPTDLESEYVYVNGLGNAHLTTENMSADMDDIAKAIAISLKESQAAGAERKPDNHKSASATATATSSAEADVKTRAPEPSAAPQSTVPARPANGAKVISKASLDDSRDPHLQQALAASRLEANKQPTEIERKAKDAAHNSSTAATPAMVKPTVPPMTATADPDLELALAMSLQENFKHPEQPARPQPVPVPVNVSVSIDLDEVGPMFGASNPRETSKPLSHLRKPIFKGRKKPKSLLQQQKSILFAQLNNDKDLLDALRLSTQS